MVDLNLLLAIFGSLLGLLITGISIYTVWMIHQLWKRQNERQAAAENSSVTPASIAGRYFSTWTVLDYGVLGLFAVGMLLLLADLLGVMRDRAAYPDYHFAYLLCGIVFSLMAMLLLFVRLVVVLSLSASNRSVSPDHQHEPSHTDQAK